MKRDLVKLEIPQVPSSLLATIRKETANLSIALALTDSVQGVEALLSQTDRFLKRARRRLNEDTETINLIQRGRFMVIEKLGALLERQRGGRGKKNLHSDCAGFHRNTLTAYRKVYDHSALINAYFDSLNGLDGDVTKEATLAGFLRHVQADNRNRNASSRFDEMRRHRNMVAQRASAELLKNEVNYACVLVDSAWHVAGDDGAEWLELGKLPIPKHTTKDAVIFVRSGGHKVAANRADTLIENWEFRPIDDGLYLQGAIDGKGRYFTKSVEEVAIGIKGSPPWPDLLPADVQRCPPDNVHELIERLTPFAQNLRLELFGRTKHPGWVSWTPGSSPVCS